MNIREIVGSKIQTIRTVLDLIEQPDVGPDPLPERPADSSFVTELDRAASATIEALARGNKLLAAGNGGSAAEAQHLTGEIVGRFKGEKRPLPAVCLHADTSTLTAVANDYGYDTVFARQVEALGKQGDVLYLLSTSGRSPNLLAAASTAKRLGISVIALLGAGSSPLKELCDIAVCVPSADPQTVQEMHLFAVHTIAWAVEEALSGDRLLTDP